LLNFKNTFSISPKSDVPLWYLCKTKFGIYHKNQFIQLDEKQYQMLLLFSQNQGNTLSKETILEAIWSGKVVTDDAVYVLLMAYVNY